MYLKKKLIWDTSLDDHQFPEEVKKVLFKNYLTLRKDYWIGQIKKDVDWALFHQAETNFTKFIR